ncbi:MAG: metallophosphoesterase [Planctomycetota bacterium]|nr:metallophosphoesterase [Planctomycetota bacterium]
MNSGSMIIRDAIRWILPAFLVSTVWVGATVWSADETPKEPAPIQIPRISGQVTIPDVARDQVIGFALYTVQDNLLKMSVQLYPLKEGEARSVDLQIQVDGKWQTLATAAVKDQSWHAGFRVENWDHTRNAVYRVVHAGGAQYEGLIRRDPVEKEVITVAAFTGNSNKDRRPRTDIIANIKAQDPDLLFFSGDQSYDHRRHTAAWLLFGRQFGEITRDRPVVSIPDDHDVGQGNLWGEGGKVSKLGGASDGGYTMPADYVKMVEQAQTSHLPDPFDATPIQQGIGVYYTHLTVGGVDFAIIEDRKFKTGPAGLIPKQGPRPDHINNVNYDPRTVDVPEARLLGERQLKFLNHWGQQWDGIEMKAVLSQTIFAGGAHIHGKHNQRLLADLDSNGWPQSGRARALRELRRCYAVHIAGDQHLATVIHHGINSWEDAGYSFCVPSIVNYYGRWWWPLEQGLNRDPKSPLPFTGRFYDGLGNMVTMQAYANPTEDNSNGAGYGLIHFDKTKRTIRFECWPRFVDVTDPDAKQHPGWPITIGQIQNYHRDPIGYLPKLEFQGAEDPVIQVVDEDLNEVVYTVRSNGTWFEPTVFRDALYTIRVTYQGETKVLRSVQAMAEKPTEVLKVKFNAD